MLDQQEFHRLHAMHDFAMQSEYFKAAIKRWQPGEGQGMGTVSDRLVLTEHVDDDEGQLEAAELAIKSM